MCGLFGFILPSDARIDRKYLRDSIMQSYKLAESRGKEAAGLAVILSDRIEIAKAPTRGRRLLRSEGARKALMHAYGALERRQTLTILAHTRMVTNGSPANPDNNQPVLRDGMFCLHNGIVVNDGEIWNKHPDLDRRFEVDTEVLVALAGNSRANGACAAESVRLALAEARGANTIAMMGAGDSELIVATTNGSLFLAVASQGEGVAFASERHILERICETQGIRPAFANAPITQVPAGSGATIPLAHPLPQPFLLTDQLRGGVTDGTQPPRRLGVHAMAGDLPVKPHVFPAEISTLSRLMKVDESRIAQLRRCTSCLLPETFPFITYDANGVCHLCRKPHNSLVRHSKVELDQLLAKHRRCDGAPDCIVPISGGRDSCYSLHYIKNELGMNPVAYTYDWGMVNDLARRNISRMCGELGVEHVLIAADIGRKRDNIRLNVEAWLKRPRLGTIPLFMAGDKQFFYYSSMLMRQMKIPLAIYSMNRLEKTDFKVGFCGINDATSHSKTYGLQLGSIARMPLYYGKEFLANPSYINRSVIDTMTGFASYYILPQDYISLFDYIHWDEETINGTIIGKYGWETASDATSTWRVGDGTAAFYNYIYYTVAGFSEHDTFRSNQIRNGLIDRQTAMAAIAQENHPRVDSFKWYCDTIGLDAVAAVETINRIPKMYC